MLGLQAGKQDHHHVGREERVNAVVVPRRLADENHGARSLGQVARVSIFPRITSLRPLHFPEIVAGRNGGVESAQRRSSERPTSPLPPWVCRELTTIRP